ncbi:YeeE/YedE family protein [Luteibacter flocculans]|uniref:YeeE/YedE family protein n=1 Tax=Luteibacter flocculans TaxID=2780091 RepID=A0ABY4SWL2_9GAMM|nr:YeeE/YedE family protein [Luteibacter flocculans]URL57108.1 YeeE/YedE family protein [Luteibacter flocculans]
MTRFVSMLAGLLFGVGLALSDMVNPQRVQAFLDVAGAWDPSLALVMISALIPSTLAWQIRRRRSRPVFDQQFHVPTSRRIDTALLSGAALFGMGWGLVGLCPGPALADLVIVPWPTLVFVVAMIAGMGVHRLLRPRPS